MIKSCYIYENLGSVNEMHRETTKDGLMHLRGTFGVCGVKNNNARIYEAGNYGKMVAEMQSRLKVKPILGELEHPQSMNITLENVSHKITEINIDENGVVSGEIVLLNTPKGKIAQAIIEGGCPLFISSRAQGSVDPRTSIVTLENLATYDLVGSPGFSQAELHLNEGQVAESICESCGYVYNVNENNIKNGDMDEQLLKRLDKLEALVEELTKQNERLQEQLDEQESLDTKTLCDGIQKWALEEFAPEIQNYIVEQYTPEIQKWIVEKYSQGVQDWIIEHYSPEIQKWIVEQYSAELQKWIVEQYSPEVQNWCQNEFATGIQNWFVEECAPEFEAWVTEHYNEEVKNQISEAVENGKKNSLSNIENTLNLLENIQTTKPTFGARQTLIKEENAPKYISEMPASARVKYDLASQEVKESIARRAKLFDFSRHTVNEFWDGVNFDNIKPMITENFTGITDERERAIRARLSQWAKSRR